MTEKALSKSLKYLIVISCVFVFMLALWIVLVQTNLLDRLMGTDEEQTQIELVPGEVLGPNNRILMFEHVDRSRISSIEIHNPDGEYTFVNNNGSFGLPQYDGMYYDEQSIASLVVSAGYTITQERVTKDAKKEDLKKYGLDDPTAYWILKTVEGRTYKVLVGDCILADGGYYGMLEGRENCIYILNSTVESNIFKPLEVYVVPLVCYGLSEQTYYLVDNFQITHGLSGAKKRDPFVHVKQCTKEEFTNPDAQVETKLQYPAGYKTDDTFFMSSVMGKFLSLVGEETVYIGDSKEKKAEFGLGEDDFIYEISFSLGSGDEMMKFVTRVSELQDDGYYYCTSNLYNHEMVVKCTKDTFNWLEYGLIEWIDDYPIMLNITGVDAISIEFGENKYTFDLIHSTDSEGNALLEVKGDDGFVLENSEVQNFREFYKVLLSVQIMGNINSELNEEGIPATFTDEEIEEIVEDENNFMGRVTFHKINGDDKNYSFHRYSTRRAIFNYNGAKNFYVLADWIEKLENDVELVLQNIEVDSHSKN